MAYDLEEQEKLDAIKQWWGRYGTPILSAAAIVLAVFAGWRGWQWYENHRASQAMGYFEALEDAARHSGDDSTARLKAAARTLREDFAGTAYAARGALVAAQALQERKDLDAAREQLEWVAKGKDPALAAVARLRLAGLLLDQKQYDQALGQLANPPQAFAALFEDRRGDVLAAQGKADEARKAWESALQTMGSEHPLAPVVQLKLDALSGAQS
jgi:Uncharacterized protein conserved in bacteria